VSLILLLLACAPGPGLAQLPQGPPPSAEDLTNSLLALSLKYQAAGPADRSGLLGELQSVAAARRERLVALIETDPAAALRFAIPAGIRAGLPLAVQADVEEQIEIEGTLLVFHEDRDGGSRYLYFLESGDRRYSLHFATDQPALLTGLRVRVKGLRVGGALILASGKSSLQIL
jgi:hypothetical protein